MTVIGREIVLKGVGVNWEVSCRNTPPTFAISIWLLNVIFCTCTLTGTKKAEINYNV